MIKEDHSLRSASRRLVIELVVVVILVGLPLDFPRDASSGAAWSFLFRHPSLVLHVAVGGLILVEAVAFLVRSMSTHRRWATPVTGSGLVFAILANGAGGSYVSAGQTDLALTLMTVGWLGAVVAYALGWILGRRGVKAAQRAVEVDRLSRG
jgi:hypothetical protein